MEFRLLQTKEIKTLLENEINKRDIILKKYKKIRNTMGVIGKVSAGITMSSGAGGIYLHQLCIISSNNCIRWYCCFVCYFIISINKIV